MDIDELFKLTKLPLGSKQRVNIPKKAIYLQMENQKSKKLLRDNVKSIYLLAILNEDTTKLRIYETDTEYFNEILLIHVDMKILEDENKIFTILAKVFPYPIIVIISYQNNSYIFTGKYEKKLVNGIPYAKVSNTYKSNKYDKAGLAKFLAKLNLNSLVQNDLKELYEWIQENILGETLNIINSGQVESRRILLSAEERDQIDLLNREISKLEIDINNEKQLNKRIPLQLELNEKRDTLKQIGERRE